MGSRLQRIERAQRVLKDMPDAARDDVASDADIEDLLEDLMRRLSDAFGDWRACAAPRCRRARCCQGPDMICQLGGGPRLDAPPDEIARANSRMRAIVMRWLEQFGVAR